MAFRERQVPEMLTVLRKMEDRLVRISEIYERFNILRGRPRARESAVYFVKAEGDIVQNAAEALGEGYCVEIVTGPRLKDAKTREGLVDLLKKYSDRLSIYSCPIRPEPNMCLINGNLLFEDPHPEGVGHNEVTAIEHADQYNITLFRDRFAALKNNADLVRTPDAAMRMPVAQE